MPHRVCAKPNCKERFLAKGLCKYHYNRQHFGFKAVRVRKKDFIASCKDKDCDRKFFAKGYCKYHYDLAYYRLHPEKYEARQLYFIERRIERKV